MRKLNNGSKRRRGFSLLEVMIALMLLLVGLVAVAQLVPISLRMNNDNRSDSVALVLAQRELDQMVDQPLKSTQFTDALGNVCNLGNPGTPNNVVGSPVATINNRPTIDFTAGQSGGYHFYFLHPEEPQCAPADNLWGGMATDEGGAATTHTLHIFPPQLL